MGISTRQFKWKSCNGCAIRSLSNNLIFASLSYNCKTSKPLAMKFFRLAFLSLLMLGSFLAQAQTVDEIVELHIKAMGGQDKWKNVHSIKMKGSLDIGPQMKAPFTLYLKDRKKIGRAHV